MLKTKDWIRSELSARLPNDERMPPFTAIETLLCEAIDRLADVPVRHTVLRPHEVDVYEAKQS